ncbi:hypothetical protein [Roseiterribacter gracilis]|uniref:Terminase n=1 Tax=Roseiterribacter gracilis TaxID=2812848 RepID=A0A8S8XL30_9PROT|nr:hypothetical protein TMPK1_40420 [Rhodospirillales bacterium TMPK1]
MTAPSKATEDPALILCAVWRQDREQLEALLRETNKRERAMFDATPEHAGEAKRLFLDAAKLSDAQGDKVEGLAQGIFRIKAKSLAGAIAKLTVALRQTEPSPRTDQEPWSYLRNVEADFERLQAEAANGTETPDKSNA